jgi:ADP-ribose pyrophosphatase
MSRIPPHARRVYEGLLFEVFQWEQELFDGSTGTFEAVRRVSSVQVLATTREGQIILLREEQPYVGSFIAVPGGRVERGRGPEETACCELREELGMEPEALVLWNVETSGSTVDWTGYDFVARRCTPVCTPQHEPGERIEPYLVSFERFLDEVERPEFRNKSLANRLFRMRHTPGALDAFRALLFAR